MSERVIIVGAGPGGLTSAMLLAKAGVDVTVLERADKVGGRTTTSSFDGFSFDLGPTFFLYPKVLEEVFAAVGRDLWREVPMVQLDPQYHLVFGGGGDIMASPDIAELEKEIASIAPDDAAGVRAYMAENRDKLDRFKPVLENAFDGLSDVMTPRMLSLLPVVRPWNSLDDELKRYFKDPRVRLAFSFQSKYLGMSPFNCPSLFSILSFLEYESGVFHPIGGCGQVSRVMANIAEELGAEIRLGESVEEVLYEGDKVVGVRSAQGEYRADAVIMNADFARAMQRMVPEKKRPSWNDKKIDKASYSCSTFMLYLGIEGRYDDLAHHTIYMSEHYQENLDEIEKLHSLSDDPSFYVQNACVTDPGLAPEGQSTLYVLVPVSHEHENIDWNQEKERFRSLVLNQLKKIGLDDVEERIVSERVVTPADWNHRFDIHKGAIFNLSHSLRQMLHLRPRNRFNDGEGLYLVGGGTHPGSGLPVIYEGARISSRLVLEDLGEGHRMPQPQPVRALPTPSPRPERRSAASHVAARNPLMAS